MNALLLCLAILSQNKLSAEPATLRIGLDTALEAAQHNSATLQAVEADRQAAEKRAASRQSPLWPRLTLDASYKYISVVPALSESSSFWRRSHLFAAYRRWIARSSISVFSAKYASIRRPVCVWRSGKRTISQSACLFRRNSQRRSHWVVLPEWSMPSRQMNAPLMISASILRGRENPSPPSRTRMY